MTRQRKHGYEAVTVRRIHGRRFVASMLPGLATIYLLTFLSRWLFDGNLITTIIAWTIGCTVSFVVSWKTEHWVNREITVLKRVKS